MIIGLKGYIHILGDFTFQAIISKFKDLTEKRKWRDSFFYAVFHGVFLIVVFMSRRYVLGFAFLMSIYYAVQLWKSSSRADEIRNIVLIVSQILVVASLAVISDWYTPWIGLLISGVSANQMFLFALSMLLTTIVSSNVIKIMISKWQPENEDTDEDSLTNAGSYIGMLERLFVFGFIVSGNLQGIGFLLAAKSVFRFGDLKDSVDRKLTEYILIGTLLSFGLAVLIGFLFLSLLEKIG